MKSYNEEHFVPIEGFDHYSISNYGTVVNTRTGTDLTPRADSNGYLRVALYKRGKGFERMIHRLVAQAFFVDFTPSIDVKHISENFQDNSVRNLTLNANKRIRVRIVETGMEFDSLQACGDFLGGRASYVSDFFKGRRKSYKGYTFEVIDSK